MTTPARPTAGMGIAFTGAATFAGCILAAVWLADWRWAGTGLVLSILLILAAALMAGRQT